MVQHLPWQPDSPRVCGAPPALGDVDADEHGDLVHDPASLDAGSLISPGDRSGCGDTAGGAPGFGPALVDPWESGLPPAYPIPVPDRATPTYEWESFAAARVTAERPASRRITRRERARGGSTARGEVEHDRAGEDHRAQQAGHDRADTTCPSGFSPRFSRVWGPSLAIVHCSMKT
jgi:hypothetical protein